MDRRPSWRGRARGMATATAAAALIAGTGAATAGADELTPIAAQVLQAPHVVTGSDDRTHLAYEIRVANLKASPVTVGSVTARSGRRTLQRLGGSALDERLFIDGGTAGLVLGPGQGAKVLMDVILPRGARAPRAMVHSVSVIEQPPGSAPRPLTFTGVATPVVHDPPIVVSPPLRGPRWVAADGCCVANAHRQAVLPIDGRFHAPERFAIDFVQITPDRRLFSGPIADFASYPYFGSRVYAAASGRVVGVHKGEPLQVPGTYPTGLGLKRAGGNYIVVRIDRDHYAFYGHLQSQSIRVRVGDVVRRGQPFALLGNAGFSGAPHLHFHIVDGPWPLKANGLPFVFTRFTGHGQVTDEDVLVSGAPTPVDAGALAGVHRRRLPLNDQIVSFP